MDHFIIDNFDFGIDATRSSFDVQGSVHNLKLVGDPAVTNRLFFIEDHAWNWLIQPPFLYVNDLPCQTNASGDFEHEIAEQELDDYDIALYATEHCDVIPCRIVKAGDFLTARGKVHRIRRSPLDFSAQFTMKFAAGAG